MNLLQKSIGLLLLLALYFPALSEDKETNNAPSPSSATTGKETPSAGGSNEGTVIQVGDKLKYSVKEDKDDPQLLMVMPSGEMDVPYFGRVNVAGKTLGQAKSSIKHLLEKDLYYQATVDMWVEVPALAVGGIKANQITVSGAVRIQGPQDMPLGGKYMLSMAILKAGGVNPFGDGKKIRIERRGKDGKPMEIMGNVDAVLKDGQLDRDIELQKDDLIIVKEKLINF